MSWRAILARWFSLRRPSPPPEPPRAPLLPPTPDLNARLVATVEPDPVTRATYEAYCRAHADHRWEAFIRALDAQCRRFERRADSLTRELANLNRTLGDKL